MAITLYGPITVEAGGAEWTFGEPVTGADLLALVAMETGSVDTERLTGAQCRAFDAYFMEAIRGWSGVNDASGLPVAFSAEVAREVPISVKVEAVCAALVKRAELSGNASGPGTEPI